MSFGVGCECERLGCCHSVPVPVLGAVDVDVDGGTKTQTGTKTRELPPISQGTKRKLASHKCIQSDFSTMYNIIAPTQNNEAMG
jgi:hypothetical protein